MLKPLGAIQLLKSHFKSADEAAPEWVSGYIGNVLEGDYKDEIKGCWTKQPGLKEKFDATYK